MRSRFPRFPLAVAVLLAAALFAARGSWPWQRLSDVPTSGAILVHSPFRIVRDTLHGGETVSALLSRQGVNGVDFSALAKALSFDPRRLKAGQVFSVRRSGTGDEVTHFEFRASPEQRLQFIRTDSGKWRGVAVPIRWTTDTIRLGANITSNLFDAIDSQVGDATLDRQERANVVYSLAEVFSYSVDFSRDLQPGDNFAAVVERRTSEEGETRFGQILAGELTVAGKPIAAFRYENGPAAGFYDADGKSLRRAFLVAPVEFRHISSGFSRARFHPVLGGFRKHEGIDFAANRGTPVRAAADGVVLRAGYTGGYGKLIELRHLNGITTRYGHLSVIGPAVRPGARVSQGAFIGRVGSTGLSTAPHLHYEFRVNNVARNPRSVKLEAGAPLPRAALAAFQRERDQLRALLGRAEAPLAARHIAE